ncbi:MAG: SAM-dependent chlorinase/fluorinase, partial [Verrucomicrobia bacterium]|nr:SAM-dependent chlorinase/fluorinase [Verrucomicrobiota bacterium]
MSGIITLLTDFGSRDAYVGIMKGVILGICPDATIVDLAHDIPPQDILAGAFQLSTAVAYFPPGTIHVAVVDPGVGTNRRSIAVKTSNNILIAPDNGLLTLALRRTPAQACYCLDRSRFKLAESSATFHGRDVFAPVAAHLMAGKTLRNVGAPISHIETLAMAVTVERADGGVEGHVMHVDHFGNAITNIEVSQIRAVPGPVEVRVSGVTLPTIS